MNPIPVHSLAQTDLAVHRIEVFAESWSNRKSFSLYERAPRPVCALFLICTDVRASFTDRDGARLDVRRGDVVLIPKGVCYRADVADSLGVGIDTYTINFELFDAEGKELSLENKITRLTSVTDGRLEKRAERLWEAAHEIEGAGGRNRLRLHGEFFLLLDLLFSSLQQHSEDYYPIRAGVDALRREWNQNEKIEKYAALCGISIAYFYRSFRRWSGKSPVEYRNLLRLSNAETMLRHSDVRIGEISSLIGFEDPFYFCRIFAKQYGMSPRDYRRTFGGKKGR